MRKFLITWTILVTGVWALMTSPVNSQDTGTTLPALPTADTGTVPLDPNLPPTEPVSLPAGPTTPEPAPPLTWQHQTQNQQGTVTNLHERTASQDGNNYSYQHSVTGPNGSRTQLREYSQTEEGYQSMNQHRFYQPDGTLLREHGTSLTGTDPYNYQRQMTHTFRDGRTMEKTFTRSYDGTAGTMERSFLGPNGQVQQFQRPWTPDELTDTGTLNPGTVDVAAPPAVDLPAGEQLGTAAPNIVDPLAPSEPASEGGLMSWLNPFKKRETRRTTSSSEAGKRAGFTIGSFGRSRGMDTMPPGQARKASGLSNSSQMHSMKTKQKQTGLPPHSTASLPGKGAKSH